MSAARAPKRRSPLGALTAARPTDASGHLFLVLPLLLVVVAMVSLWAWQTVRNRTLGGAEYRLDAHRIELNAPPNWCRAEDVRSEVIRNAGLDRPLSILDKRLTQTIAMAFAAHPWVAEVVRVEKFYPARVQVTLRYREPVAVVYVDGRGRVVDRDGVLLPQEDFSPVQLSAFPAIQGIDVLPVGSPGTHWGDSKVHTAAMIAGSFGPRWQRLDLAAIVPSTRNPSNRRAHATFELITQSGTRIAWGSQRAGEDSAELTAEAKIRRLEQYADQYGSLDARPGRDVATESPRTATSKGALKLW